jgi:hypothetical protein
MISFRSRQSKLKELYSNLIQITKEYRENNEDKSYVLFGGIAGCNYKYDGLMIIGRSPNGWHRYKLSLEDLFDGCDRLFDYPEKLTELKKHNKTSRLWQVLSKIGNEIFNGVEDWEQSIFYSNYYKLAPDEVSEPNGTPPKVLRDLQKDICSQILKLELDTFRPKHIIAFTGCYVRDMSFSEVLMNTLLSYYLNKVPPTWPEPIKRVLWGNGRYALEVYKINETYIYLTEHPDRKSCIEHANILINELKSNM